MAEEKNSDGGDVDRVQEELQRERDFVNEFMAEIGEALHIRHKKRDEIVSYSRNITWESKRCISQIVGWFTNKNALRNAQGNINNILKNERHFIGLAKALHGEDSYMFTNAYSAGIQEFVEALAVFTFFSENRLLTYKELLEKLTFTWKIPAEAEGEEPCVIKYCFVVDQLDFFLGLADIAGELVRACGSGANTVHFKPWLFKSCSFLREFYAGYSTLCMYGQPRLLKSHGSKLNTMRVSVMKLEKACYRVTLGERLTFADFSRNYKDDDDDSGCE